MAVIATAVSFFIIIISIAIASGFRREIGRGISSLTGDIQLTTSYSTGLGADEPVNSEPACLGYIREMRGVKSVTPAIYRAGIAQNGEDLQGVIFKAVPSSDSIPLQVGIPRSLARTLRLKEGDSFRSYFIGERLQVRKFTVREIYDAPVDASGTPVVLAPMEDIRRVNGWKEGQASALEIVLDDSFRTREKEKSKAVDIAGLAYGMSEDDADPVMAIAAVDKYAAIFNWLELIDFNVFVLLLLMILVAGFNMISGLLIMLFRNISTIGTLKSLGMKDRGIAGVFLRVALRVVLAGMAVGNVLALLFCALQAGTHFIRLNPENYFLSYVPVHVSLPGVLAVDAIACVAIMLLLLIPALFISRVDPAETVRMK